MSYPDDLIDQVQRLARFGIAVLDLGTGSIEWSDELFRLYGWEPGEVTPGLETLLQRVNPADASRVRTGFDRSRAEHGTPTIEFRIVLSDGGTRTLLARSRAFADRIVSTVIDISEHKETAARLVFADRMASVGTLAGGVAHEINNPLAFIAAHVDLIERQLSPRISPEVATMLEDTRYGVSRIRDIVHGLQAFSRTDEDQRAPLDLRQVIELAVRMAGNEIRHRAELVQSYGELPAIVANQAALGQVFVNLLVNAAEAIPEGQTQRNQIAIATRTDGAGWAVIEVRDTGRGIARDIQDRIFDPFFTTKPIGKGTGLGLSICHGIVRSLGGEIGFTSEPGTGTVFRVALPPAVAVTRAAATEVVAPIAAPGTGRPTKVLIIDDEVVFANALRRLLSKDHHAVSILTDGNDAIVRVRGGERFDAILCDLMMPTISGMEVHAQLVAVAPEQAHRMIFLTGGAFSPSAKEFLDQVKNTRFDKPCDLEALRSAILQVAKS